MTMKLVANMMMLNEAPFLSEVIKQLHELCDRIVIQDNGSTDNTIAVCRDLMGPQDILIEYEQGDPPHFSELRNNMLNYVTHGEWVLKWDADELPSTAMHNNLRKEIEARPDVLGWTIPCYHIMQKPDMCLRFEMGHPHMCLFKHGEKVRYEGLVHEQVYGLDNKLAGFNRESGIAIIHFSYWAETRFRRKAIKYAQMPNSGFKRPEDLTSRLRTNPAKLPDQVTYKAPKKWLKRIKEAP